MGPLNNKMGNDINTKNKNPTATPASPLNPAPSAMAKKKTKPNQPTDWNIQTETLKVRSPFC